MKSHFVPESFVLTDNLKQWAREKAPWLDIEEQEELWRDYEYKRTYSDWNRVWRNWIRKAIEFNPKPQSYQETSLDLPEFAGKDVGQSKVVELRRAIKR